MEVCTGAAQRWQEPYLLGGLSCPALQLLRNLVINARGAVVGPLLTRIIQGPYGAAQTVSAR